MGLGNPGEKYRATRHNIGEDTVRAYAGSHSVHLKRLKSWGEAGKVPGSPIVLAVPSGYMNTSGGPVSALANYFSVPANRVIVVHDDLDLDAGVVRMKQGGGHGGHNGLRDIDRALGTQEYVRVRMGIGRPPGRMDPAAYVLKPFARAEADQVALQLDSACEAITMVVSEGLAAAQQRFHAPG